MAVKLRVGDLCSLYDSIPMYDVIFGDDGTRRIMTSRFMLPENGILLYLGKLEPDGLQSAAIKPVDWIGEYSGNSNIFAEAHVILHNGKIQLVDMSFLDYLSFIQRMHGFTPKAISDILNP